MYTGFLLMVGGTAVGFRNASVLAALVVCFLGAWWKLREEETLLSKHFPEAYRRYKSNTKALIPFIF
jgi:protein-S-isoprenylcysteine O-methyltransferase Ste14